MRAIFLMAAIAACSGGDSAHDEVDCPMIWGPVTNQRCERACAAGPTCASNDTTCLNGLPACKVRDASTGFPNCMPTNIATHDGERGCCEAGAGGDQVFRFTACEGE